jgi:hypothetical protein
VPGFGSRLVNETGEVEPRAAGFDEGTSGQWLIAMHDIPLA